MDYINFKLHGDQKFRDKNNFFEFQIESNIQQLQHKRKNVPQAFDD